MPLKTVTENKKCPVCGDRFESKNPRRIYDTPECRQKSYRDKLITIRESELGVLLSLLVTAFFRMSKESIVKSCCGKHLGGSMALFDHVIEQLDPKEYELFRTVTPSKLSFHLLTKACDIEEFTEACRDYLEDMTSKHGERSSQ